MSVPVPSTPTNPAELREQIAQALALARDYREGTSDAVDFGPSVADYADARAALSVVAPVLEGLRAERDRAVPDAIAELIEFAHEARRIGWAEDRSEEYIRHWGAVAGWLRSHLPAGHPLAYRRAVVETDEEAEAHASRPSVSDQTPATPDDAVQTAVVADLRERAERYRDRCVGKPSDGPHAFAAQVLDHLAMGYEIALPEPAAPSSVQGDTTPDDLAEQFPELANARIRFWVCPVHRELTDDRGRRIATVEWRGGIAHCTTGDCQITSATSAPSEGDHHA